MKLLVTSALCGEERLDALRALGHDVVYVHDERGALPEGAHGAEGVVCNALFVHHHVAGFPNLRFVQLTSAGLDRAPVAELVRRGIALFNARGVYSVPMAEWVVLQVLQLAKRARFFLRNQDERGWQKARDLRELAGLTACVVGFGDVGSEVAKRLAAFDMQVIAVDPRPTDSPWVDRVVTPDALRSVVPDADLVVLAAPLTPDTRHLVDDDLIAAMKLDALLVNVSRGAVIDEAALLRALDAGRFAGVALDVVENEPLEAASPLWGFERVLITPHNSFVSDRAAERLMNCLVCNLKKQG